MHSHMNIKLENAVCNVGFLWPATGNLVQVIRAQNCLRDDGHFWAKHVREQWLLLCVLCLFLQAQVCVE